MRKVPGPSNHPGNRTDSGPIGGTQYMSRDRVRIVLGGWVGASAGLPFPSGLGLGPIPQRERSEVGVHNAGHGRGGIAAGRLGLDRVVVRLVGDSVDGAVVAKQHAVEFQASLQ